MNIYRCVSETLWGTTPILDDGTGPYEPYCIAEIVAAPTPAVAKYIAYKVAENHGQPIYDMRDMPKFSVIKVRSGVDLPEGIVSRPRASWWYAPKDLRKAWRERHDIPREARGDLP